MTRRARTGLVWRLYAIGVVQFQLVVLATLAISFVMSDLPGRWDMQSLSARLKPRANDPAALARELQELRASDKLLVSVYDERERLLVSNVVPALLPPRLGGSWPHRPQSSEYPAPPGVIDADPVLLRRAVDNLLENAHKYSPEPDAAISLKVSEQGARVLRGQRWGHGHLQRGLAERVHGVLSW